MGTGIELETFDAADYARFGKRLTQVREARAPADGRWRLIYRVGPPAYATGPRQAPTPTGSRR
jgi:hypothetical protein